MMAGMKLVMTTEAFRKAMLDQSQDDSNDALEIVEDDESPSGYSLMVCLNHWTPTIHIEVQR